MATITTRAGKGSPLTNTELDNNFTNLNTAKYESGALPTFGLTTITTGNDTPLRVYSTDGSAKINIADSTGSVGLQTYSSGQLRFQVGGDANAVTGQVETVRFTSSASVFNDLAADVDFRVESVNNTTAIFLNAGTDQVGLFTASLDGRGKVAIANTAPYDYVQPDGRMLWVGSDTSGTGSRASLIVGRGTYGGGGNQYSTIGLHPSHGNDGFTTGFDLEVERALSGTNHAAFQIVRSRRSGSTGRTLNTPFKIVGSDSPAVVINDDSTSYTDFRVESDSNTHMLFVNAGDNRVSIGGSSTSSAVVSLQGGGTALETVWIYGQATGKGGRIASIRDGRATPGTDGSAGLRFTSSPGTDYVVGKYYDGGLSHFMITDQSGNEYYTIEAAASSVFNQGGASGRDFRVESDANSHMLFVDAGNNRVGVGTTGTDYTGSDFVVQGRATFNDGQTTAGRNLIVDGYAAASDDNILVIGTQRSSGGPFIGYGLGQNNTDSYWAATYDNFNGAHSVLVLSGAALQFRHDRSNSQTAVGSEVPTKDMFSIDRNEAVFNQDSVDQDFRVETDGLSHALFVDASADQVQVNAPFVMTTYTGYNSDANRVFEIGSSNYTTSDVNRFSKYTLKVSGNASGQDFNIYGTQRTGSAASVDYSLFKLAGYSGTAVINEDGLPDADFKVESDSNSNMLFVDAGNNYVGVGTGSPTAPLTVNGRGVDFGRKGAGQNTEGRYLMIEGSALPNGEASGRIMFTEHNSTTEAADSYGLSIHYEGDGSTVFPSGFAPGTTNAQWQIRGHNGSLQGLPIITGVRSSQGFTVHGGIVVNEDSLNSDFRVESDSNSNMFHVDASAGDVTIGNLKNNSAWRSTDGVRMIGYGHGTGGYMEIVRTTNSDISANVYMARNNDGRMFSFNTQTNSVGEISITASGTTYNTTSDRRLKDNIEAVTDGTAKVMAMNPVTHTWIADPESPAVHGFIAQEMQEIIPEAVSGTPDGEEMMSMDYGRITPVLVAALQDAHKKIAELEARLNTLEAK